MTERELFEAEYRKVFPMIASIVLDVFSVDDCGDYVRANVFCSYKLWQAARTPSAEAACDRDALPLNAVLKVAGDWMETGTFTAFKNALEYEISIRALKVKS